MRHVEKKGCLEWSQFCAEFENRLKSKTWGNFTKITIKDNGEKVNVASRAKATLRRRIWEEQLGLCIYCTQLIPETAISDKSHLEHVQPVSRFPKRRFEYLNIVVSCNGVNCSTEDVETDKEYCGHFKDDARKSELIYDAALFVDPTLNEEIESFFEYNIEGEISPNRGSLGDLEESIDYMITCLGLDKDDLMEYRKETYNSMVEIEMIEGEEMVEDMLKDESHPLLSFHPMLKALFAY